MSGDFLGQLDKAFAKRRKAIRHKCRRFDKERVRVIEDGVESERREIECAVTGADQPAELRLHAWDDRWLFIDARLWAKHKGWLWEWTIEGRFIGADFPRGVVDRFEQTMSTAQDMTPRDVHLFSEIWREVIASGPRAI